MDFRRALLGRRPLVSIVVVSYNMEREIPRTLFTLSTPYQRGINAEDLEIILVDNGSRRSPDPGALPPRTRLLLMEDPSPSPVAAINRGLAQARGRLVGVMIDGARMASPGMVASALQASRLAPRTVISTLAFHLGPDVQRRSIQDGYCQAQEDRLLEGVDWRADGYELFRISTFAGSSAKGWFAPMTETSALFMPISLWREHGGFHPGFKSAGGGLANIDAYMRAWELPDTTLVTLLGEATFHQVHGGIATNLQPSDALRRQWLDEFVAIQGRSFKASEKPALFLGSIPAQAAYSVAQSAAFFAS